MHRMRWKYVRSPTEIILRACGVNGALPRASGPQGSCTPQRPVRAEISLVHLEESRAKGPQVPGQPWQQHWREDGDGRACRHSRVRPYRHQTPRRRWPRKWLCQSGLGLTLHVKLNLIQGDKIRWSAAVRAWGRCKGRWRLTYSCLLPVGVQGGGPACTGHFR